MAFIYNGRSNPIVFGSKYLTTNIQLNINVQYIYAQELLEEILTITNTIHNIFIAIQL